MPPWARLTLRLSEADDRLLAARARSEGRSKQQVAREAIHVYLTDEVRRIEDLQDELAIARYQPAQAAGRSTTPRRPGPGPRWAPVGAASEHENLTNEIVWADEASAADRGFMTDDPAGLAEVFDTVDALAGNPRPPEALQWGNTDVLRLRIGRYLVLYEIDEQIIRIEVVHPGETAEVRSPAAFVTSRAAPASAVVLVRVGCFGRAGVSPDATEETDEVAGAPAVDAR